MGNTTTKINRKIESLVNKTKNYFSRGTIIIPEVQQSNEEVLAPSPPTNEFSFDITDNQEIFSEESVIQCSITKQEFIEFGDKRKSSVVLSDMKVKKVHLEDDNKENLFVQD